MNKIITLAAAVSVLALGACNRDVETAPVVDDAAPTSAEAAAASDARSDASTTASRSSRGVLSAGASGSASETMGPAGSSSADPTGATAGGLSDQTRDNAQQAAEETNLHPKPSGAH